MSDNEKIIAGSGNVFADLGLPNADELQCKASLVIQIAKIIQMRELSQTEASKVLGLPQPKVSDLLKGKLFGFSTDRLFRLLLLLGQDIEISVKPIPKKTGREVGSIYICMKNSRATPSKPKRSPKAKRA